MDTYIAYFDEAGDDGNTIASSDFFVLTGLYMSSATWSNNYEKIRSCRAALKDQFGFHATEELHTKYLLADKEPYRKYGWTVGEKKEIIKQITQCIASFDAKIINVVVDKNRITTENYSVLKSALEYSIQQIEDDSNGKWNYLIISDKGRIAPMRNIARSLCTSTSTQTELSSGGDRIPAFNLVEDILEKDSSESYFIQVCDFVSYMVHLYYKTHCQQKTLPNRVGRVVDEAFVTNVMTTLEAGGILNCKENNENCYGLIVLPEIKSTT